MTLKEKIELTMKKAIKNTFNYFSFRERRKRENESEKKKEEKWRNNYSKKYLKKNGIKPSEKEISDFIFRRNMIYSGITILFLIAGLIYKIMSLIN